MAICLPGDQGWRVYQGASEDLTIDGQTLDMALAKARGVVEFDARQRAYGGHVCASDRMCDISIVPLRHGTKAIGLLAASSSTIDIGALDALAGVVAIAIERAQFLAERDAAELVRQKADLASALLASLSHDLRTPLTAIRVAVENLREELPADERREQSRGDLGAESLTPGPGHPRHGRDRRRRHPCRSRLGHGRRGRGCGDRLRQTHARRTSAVNAAGDLEVEIDPRLASGALSHILENAAQCSPAGREIAVNARVDHDGLHISVTDQGPGLDAGELEHLFERFYRGQSARQTTFGTGMGLSITRGLLAAAGGRVWAGTCRAAERGSHS